jgi:hypothetical protein
MKPKEATLTQEEFDAQNPNKEKVPLSFSDLDSLKYSGGFVFFAKSGLELESFKQFQRLTGDFRSMYLGKYKEKEITAEINSYLERVKPYVKEIQVQIDNVYQNAEGSDNIIRDTKIKIIFTNDADQLTFEQKRKIKDNKGQNFEFGVGLITGSIVPNGNVKLSTDDFVNTVPLDVASVEAVGTSGSEFLITTSSPMATSTNHKLKVLKSVARADSLILKEEFISEKGFNTELTTSSLGIS